MWSQKGEFNLEFDVFWFNESNKTVEKLKLMSSYIFLKSSYWKVIVQKDKWFLKYLKISNKNKRSLSFSINMPKDKDFFMSELNCLIKFLLHNLSIIEYFLWNRELFCDFFDLIKNFIDRDQGCFILISHLEFNKTVIQFFTDCDPAWNSDQIHIFKFNSRTLVAII